MYGFALNLKWLQLLTSALTRVDVVLSNESHPHPTETAVSSFSLSLSLSPRSWWWKWQGCPLPGLRCLRWQQCRCLWRTATRLNALLRLLMIRRFGRYLGRTARNFVPVLPRWPACYKRWCPCPFAGWGREQKQRGGSGEKRSPKQPQRGPRSRQKPRSLLRPPPPTLGLSSAVAKLRPVPSRWRSKRRPELLHWERRWQDTCRLVSSCEDFQIKFTAKSYCSNRTFFRLRIRSPLLLLFVRTAASPLWTSQRDDVTGKP